MLSCMIALDYLLKNFRGWGDALVVPRVIPAGIRAAYPGLLRLIYLDNMYLA